MLPWGLLELKYVFLFSNLWYLRQWGTCVCSGGEDFRGSVVSLLPVWLCILWEPKFHNVWHIDVVHLDQRDWHCEWFVHCQPLVLHGRWGCGSQWPSHASWVSTFKDWSPSPASTNDLASAAGSPTYGVAPATGSPTYGVAPTTWSWQKNPEAWAVCVWYRVKAPTSSNKSKAVVSNVFLLQPYLENWSNLTNILIGLKTPATSAPYFQM